MLALQDWVWSHANLSNAGNQYSIENELDKSARIFFSQGCEPTPMDDEAGERSGN